MAKFSLAICLTLTLLLCGCGSSAPEADTAGLRQSPFVQEEISGLQTHVSNQTLQEMLPEDCPLAVAWTVPNFQNPAKKIWLPPAELGLNYLLVLTEANDLLAFRRSDGNPLWWTKLGNTPPLGAPAFTNSSIYLLLEGHLLNLERHSGDVIWQLRLGFPPSPFLAAKEPEAGKPTLYVASLNRVIYGLTVKETIWPPENSAGKITREDLIIKNHKLFTNWTYTTQGLIEGPITFRENLLYAADSERYLYCLNPTIIKTGHPEVAWETITSGPNTAGVKVRGERVYLASRDRGLYCFHYDSHRQLWHYESGYVLKELPAVVEDPATADEMVLLQCSDGPLVSLATTSGDLLWTMASGGSAAGLDLERDAPPERRTTVIIRQPDGALQGVRFLSGEALWSIPAGIFGLVAENSYAPGVYAFTEDGKTLCALTR